MSHCDVSRTAPLGKGASCFLWGFFWISGAKGPPWEEQCVVQALVASGTGFTDLGVF